MTRQFLVLVYLCLFAASAVYAESTPPTPLTLDWTVRAALQAYPEVRAKHHAAAAAQARIAPAGALADPSVGVMLDRARGASAGQDRETMFEFSQPLSFVGKRGLRREVARQDAAAAEVELFGHHLEAQAQAQGAYLDYWASAERLRLMEDQRRLLNAFAPAVRTRSLRNLTMPRDLTIDSARLDADIARARQQHAAARMQLNVLLARALDAELPPAAAPEIPPPAPLAAALARAEGAFARREAAVQLARADAQWRLARRERAPDFAVFGRYTVAADGMDDRVRIGANMTLPLWAARKQGPAVIAAAAERAGRQEQQRAVAENVVREIRTRYEALAAERAGLNAFERDVLPRTAQLAEIASGAYRAGRADVLQMLDLRETQFRAELEALERRVAYAQARFALDRAVGVLPAETMPAAISDAMPATTPTTGAANER